MTTDLRMPLLGLAAWAGALLVRWQPDAVQLIALAAVVPVLVAVRWPRRRRAALTAVAMVAVASGVGVVALVRAEAVHDGPVATAAQQRALVTLAGTVASDPRRIEGRFGDRVLVPADVSIDLGSTAKAWASDLVAHSVSDEVGPGVLVSLGGDVAALPAASGTPWPVAVSERASRSSTAE